MADTINNNTNNTKQRKEKFQGLLSYFENFAHHFTPKKSKAPKAPKTLKSESKLSKKKLKTPKSDSKLAKMSKTPKSTTKKATKEKKFDASPIPLRALHDKENIPLNNNEPAKKTTSVLQEVVINKVKKEVPVQETKEKKEVQIEETKKEKKEVQIQEVKKEKKEKEKECYDSDSSYAHTTQRKKRRQSFSSVRIPKKQNRRMTLAAGEISPILLVRPLILHIYCSSF